MSPGLEPGLDLVLGPGLEPDLDLVLVHES